jgi:dipeptidyl aminopeptidase/acylaminoacyl peptidase
MKKFQTPIYLGHGKLDKVVPFQQTELFYQTIKKINPTLSIVCHIDEQAGHDYKYWDSELDSIFTFFQSISTK